jgi:hypothetical protein
MSVDATAGVEELGGVGAWGPVVQHAAMVSRSLLTTTRSAAGSTCPANPWRERARGRWQGKLRSQPSRTQQEQAAAGRARAERAVKRLLAWRLPAWRLGLFTRDRPSAPSERRPDRQPSFDRRGRRQPTLPPIPSATAGAELPPARARKECEPAPGRDVKGGNGGVAPRGRWARAGRLSPLLSAALLASERQNRGPDATGDHQC